MYVTYCSKWPRILPFNRARYPNHFLGRIVWDICIGGAHAGVNPVAPVIAAPAGSPQIQKTFLNSLDCPAIGPNGFATDLNNGSWTVRSPMYPNTIPSGWPGYNNDPNVAPYFNDGWSLSNTCPNLPPVVYPPDQGGPVIVYPVLLRKDPKCPAGYDTGSPCLYNTTTKPLITAKNKVPGCGVSCANPINVGAGSKYQVEVDYRSGGQLEMVRYYGSSTALLAPLNEPTGWTASYTQVLKVNTAGTPVTVMARRPEGTGVFFVLSAGSYIADSDIADKLVEIVNGGITTGWQYTHAATENIETYDALGKLLSIEDRAGRTQLLTYSDGLGGRYPVTAPVCNGVPGAPAPTVAGLLICVTDHFGRQLNFARDAFGRVSKMTDPNGGLYQYLYDGATGPAGANNLTSVIYPDSM